MLRKILDMLFVISYKINCLFIYNLIEPPPAVEAGKKVRAVSPSKTHVPTGRPSAYEDILVSNIRGVIAKRLGEAKVITHFSCVCMIKIIAYM